VLFRSIFGGDDAVSNVTWRVHVCDVTKARRERARKRESARTRARERARAREREREREREKARERESAHERERARKKEVCECISSVYSNTFFLFQGISSTFVQSISHCNTLHHSVIHCDTLQHTATHCNKHMYRASLSVDSHQGFLLKINPFDAGKRILETEQTKSHVIKSQLTP